MIGICLSYPHRAIAYQTENGFDGMTHTLVDVLVCFSVLLSRFDKVIHRYLVIACTSSFRRTQPQAASRLTQPKR